jgi:hypothetical protein
MASSLASASAAAGPSSAFAPGEQQQQQQLSPSRVQQSPLQSSPLQARQAPSARPGDNIDWYVAVKGKQHGPCKKDDVIRLFREGKITDRTYLWNEAMPAWARLREVPQFASLLSESGAAAPKRPPPPPPSDEQQSAGAEIIPFDDIKRARDNATGVSGNASSSLQNDPFAAVSQPMLGGDAAPRDSTRVFIMQAGLANRGRKQRLYAYVAGGIIAFAVAILVADWQGLIEIPGLHNVVIAVQHKDEPKKTGNAGPAWDDTEEDPALKCKLAGALYDDCVKKVVAENVVKRAHHASKGGTPGPDLSGAFNTTGPGSDAIPRAGSGELAGGPLAGGLSAADAAAVLALKKDEKKVALVKLVIPSDAQPQIDGQDLDPKNVALVVKENTPAIQDCIEKAAKSGTVPHGKQWLVVGVEPNGRVSSARFKDAATSVSDAGECISKSAKKWKFAPFPGPPTDAEIPLLFSLSN